MTEFLPQATGNCLELPEKIGYTENCRLVFGEADGLPALIIDKFGDYFVIQTLALGMDLWKPAIVDALKAIFQTEKFLKETMCRSGNWKE